MASLIRILAPTKFSPADLTNVAAAIELQFQMPVETRAFAFDLNLAHDRTRGQYLSAALIRHMCAQDNPGSDVKLLGMLEVDLFAPVLTFVFGEAQLGGSCAVLSTFRLRNEFYGIPPDDSKLSQRIVKEAVHEVGHLFGLIHCRTFDCVMRSSTYVEEIDLKTAGLCRTCQARLPVGMSA